jgi:hypothetical protein
MLKSTATLLVAAIAVATAQSSRIPSRQLDPLVNAELTILNGEYQPARTHVLNGQELSIPEGCK